MGISFLKNEKGKNTRMILSFVKQLHSHPLLLENFAFFFFGIVFGSKQIISTPHKYNS